jgi:aspartate/methionine/tyrosine aminotransferase
LCFFVCFYLSPAPRRYSATITLLGGTLVPYFLDESGGWAMSLAELRRAYDAAEAEGVTPRAMVIINPGNPTGQVLSRTDIETVLAFCAERDLLLLSDEVYQPNIYNEAEHPFVRSVCFFILVFALGFFFLCCCGRAVVYKLALGGGRSGSNSSH